MWQYRKVYERYRVPNYRKIMNFNREENRGQSSNQNTYYNKNIEHESTNYNKEQGRSNFDKEASITYKLFKQIKEEMSSLREELEKVNERLSRLENRKQQETASTNQILNVNSVEKGKN